MRTKALLPLAALAIVATALPAGAQESIDTQGTMVLDEPVLTYAGVDHIVCPNPNGGPVPIPSDVIVIMRNAASPPEVWTSDIQRRGPQHL